MAVGNREVFVGLDTSCYTTSLAMVDLEGRIVKDLRRILKVKPGDRGLRQSEALFQHLNNLPELLAEATEGEIGYQIKGVGISARPRPQKGSYLPVFRAGVNLGKVMALSAGVSYRFFTHQEGHIRSALEGTGLKETTGERRFLGFHLSGGTTEVLLINPGAHGGFNLRILGGTTDLHAGQMIDRLGVALGLPFPAGRHLEELARKTGQIPIYSRRPKGKHALPVSVQGLSLSLSGPTSAAFRLLKAGIPPPELARAVQDCLLQSVAALVEEAVQATACRKILFFGGVAANLYLREGLLSFFPQLELFFAQPGFSTDNAVGLSLLAWEDWRRNL